MRSPSFSSAILSSLQFPLVLFYLLIFFFFNDTATTEIYTLSLHDALPISSPRRQNSRPRFVMMSASTRPRPRDSPKRSEEHTSELQSRQYLVCRLLLEKKKQITDRFVSMTLSTNYAQTNNSVIDQLLELTA